MTHLSPTKTQDLGGLELQMRKAKHFLFTLAHFALAISLLTGLALAGDQANIPPRKDYSDVAAVLKALIGREMEVKQLPAFSIALVDSGEIVWAQGFGYQDPDRENSCHRSHRLSSGLGIEAIYRHRDHADGGVGENQTRCASK